MAFQTADRLRSIVVQSSCFASVDFDAARFAEDMKARPATRSFGIFFTPRSGSSWLTEVLTRTRLLGRPMEWFNPNHVPKIAAKVNANTIDRYVDLLKRRQATRGLFSYEVTIYQMRRMFGTDEAFLRHFPASDPVYYLRREDIVLQAVSLAKATRTGIFHNVQSTAEEVDEADRAFDYDTDLIEEWLDHILDQEKKCEAFFSANGIVPRRLSYEANIAAGAVALANRFLHELRNHSPADLPVETRHAKIGTERNSDFAGRFRRDRPAVMERIAGERPPLRLDEPVPDLPRPRRPRKRRQPGGAGQGRRIAP